MLKIYQYILKNTAKSFPRLKQPLDFVGISPKFGHGKSKETLRVLPGYHFTLLNSLCAISAQISGLKYNLFTRG